MRVPELHHVFHLFLSRHDPKRPDRSAEIQALHQQLTRGKARFADLVAKHFEDSLIKVLAGYLGWVSASRMPAEFMEALERTPVGVFSPPIETKLGWHLVRVSARHESRLPSFVEVREEIIALLDQQRREAALGQVNW
jgi:peptidyl-prolyl cis-trans isomerase D